MQPTTRQIKEWFDKSSQAKGLYEMDMPAAHLARIAYAAGADAELEACEQWLMAERVPGYACQLRAARRSKPPKLKQQALEALAVVDDIQPTTAFDDKIAIIRRALESLPDPQD